ncbi:MAG: hypothetical protein U0800_21900 [Isosphaeraceae bacterium]
MMIRPAACLLAIALGFQGAPPKQPKVQPGPNEPDWVAILDAYYGLSMFGDLANPLKTTAEATPGRFRKAGPGEVTFTPLLALGLEVPIHGGHYEAKDGADPARPAKVELWSYQFKHAPKEIESGHPKAVPLREGSSTRFDPGSAQFGLWIGNDQFHDAVFTQPAVVAAVNPRLAKQPYKTMIYPYRDKATGKVVPHSYLIGWEYSTNDDFQDVVCRVDNVELVP